MHDEGPLRELSRIAALIAGRSSDRVAISDLIATLGPSGPVALVLLFALPNVVPMPPGTSAVLGAPLVFLTVQWAFGCSAWLPRAIAARTITKGALARAVHTLSRWFAPGPGLHAGRPPLGGPLLLRLVGAFCVPLALAVLLPIPFGNIPPALAISLCALGVLRQDGRWIGAGVLVGVGSLALVWAVIDVLGRALLDVLARSPA